MSEFKLRTWKYKDATISEQWNTLLDGEWPWGDLDEKIFIKDYNFYE